MKDKEKAKQIVDRIFECGFNTNRTFYDMALNSAMEMAEWKDSKIRDILLSYTKWLDKRGFVVEDLQCDFGHQIDTFLEMNKNE